MLPIKVISHTILPYPRADYTQRQGKPLSLDNIAVLFQVFSFISCFYHFMKATYIDRS